MDYDDNENNIPNQNNYDENNRIQMKESTIKMDSIINNNEPSSPPLKDPFHDITSHSNSNHSNINKLNTQSTFISKPFSSNTQKTTTLHVHKPVPKSKLEKAEDKYYSLKNEIESKIFSSHFNDTSITNNQQNPSNISRKNKEMISYLEKLNSVLSEIIENTKITNKQNARLRRAQPQQNEYSAQEQEQLNENSQKLIEVYKKEYMNLKSKLDKVSNGEYLLKLQQEKEEIDNEINRLVIETKKLKNEQKLNDIALSKLNKGDNKSEIELKRLVMDCDSLKRQKVTLENKLKTKKQMYDDNNVKIDYLNDFQAKLENIAKDMYNITEFENVKNEEKNQKRREKIKQNLIYKIGILQKAILSNKKKYNIEIKKNTKKINELKSIKQSVIDNYIKNGGVYQDDNYFYPPETQYDLQEEMAHKKKYSNDITQINKEDKEAVLKEIDNLLKEKHKENDDVLININNNNNNSKDIDTILIEDNAQHVQPYINNNVNNVTKDDIVNNRTADLISDHNDNDKKEEEHVSENEINNEEKESKEENENENDSEDEKKLKENEIIHKEEIPKFLEGFVDDVNEDNNQIDKSETHDVVNNDINISNKAIKDRRSKIEVFQKESFDNLLKLNKVNIQHEREKENEYEDLEEFQI